MTPLPPPAAHPAPPAARDGWFIEETRFAPHARTDVHHHHGATLSIIFHGGYVERFGSRTLTGDQWTAVFKPPQFDHQNEMSSLGLHALYVELSSTTIEGTELTLPSGPVTLRGPRIAAAVARMRRALPCLGEDSAELSLQHDLLEILGQTVPQTARTADSPRQPWLARVRARLHDELTDAPTIAALAADAGVHPVHLAQAFRRRYGCTIGDYLRECRVARAAVALRGAQPISSIAHDSGFADHSHLTRTFRRVVGCTPAEYRRLVS